MRRIRKLIACMVAIAIIAANGMGELIAYAAEATNVVSGTCGENLAWELDADGVLIISGSGDMDDYYTTSVPWEEHCQNIKKIIVQDGVTSIGRYAFSDCKDLTDIEIAKSVTKIGLRAFYDNETLKTMRVYSENIIYPSDLFWAEHSPSSTVLIGYAGSTTDIYASENNMGFGTFEYLNAGFGVCGHNVYYVIDETGILTVSGEGKMKNYSSSSAPWYADRENIQQVIIEEGVTNIGNYTFYQCSNLTEVVIPESVTNIGNYTFYQCSSLTEVVIPESVKSIGDYACLDCDSLNRILVHSENVTYGDSVFDSSHPVLIGYENSTTDEYAKDNELSFGRFDQIEQGLGVCGHKVYYTLDENGTLTISGNGPMTNYSSSWKPTPWSNSVTEIKKVVIEEGVTSVGSDAFEDCSNLTEVEIPESVTSIGDYAFCYCDSLKRVLVHSENVTYGDDVFYYSNPVLIGYENSTTDEYAKENELSFGTFDQIEQGLGVCGHKVYYTLDANGTLTISGNGPMTNYFSSWMSTPWSNSVTEIKKVVIEEGVTSVGSDAFEDCSNLTEVEIPESVTSIGSYAFERCSSLTEVVIPESVTSIGDYAFYYCDSLKRVLVYSENVTYEDDVFYCSNPVLIGYENSTTDEYAKENGLSFGTFDQIEQGLGVCGHKVYYTLDANGTLTISGNGPMTNYSYTSAPWYASREGIQQVIIEEGVTSVGKYAFYCCVNMTEVTIPEGVMSIGYAAFSDCSNLLEVEIPASVTKLEGWIFDDCDSLNVVKVYSTNTSYGQYLFVNGSQRATLIGYEDSTTDEYAKENGLSFGTFDQIEQGLGVCGHKVYYTLDANGTLTISGNGPMTNYSSSWNPTPWSDSITEIKKVVIEEGVTSVGSDAFEDCSNLTEVVIPESVTSIGSYAFDGCSSLTAVVIPEGVTSIGRYAFDSCSSLTEVKIPESVTSIGDYAFYDCDSLKRVFVYSENVTYEDDVFYYSNPVLIGYENSTTDAYAKEKGISFAAFTEVEQANNACGHRVFYELDEDGCLTISGNGPMTNYTESSWSKTTAAPWYEKGELIKRVVIEEGVTSIGNNAFSDCKNLTEIVIPESVQKISLSAFLYRKLNVIGHDGSTADVYAKENGMGFGTVEAVEEGLKVCGYKVYFSLDDQGTLTISGSGQMIIYSSSSVPWYADRNDIQKVIIEEGVTSIGNYAFYACSNLTEVTIPEGVTNIGSYAFYNCSRLSGVKVYSKDAAYGSDVFLNCGQVKLVGYESSTTDIYAQANGKIFLTFDEVEKIDYAFAYRMFYTIDDAGILTISGKGDMKNFSSASSVPWYADRENIQQVIVEEGITSIGSFAFSGCSSLTEVTIPGGVTTIGNDAFNACSSLTEVTIPGGVTTIGNSAFNACSSLTEVAIPEGVTSIEDYTFSGCRSLIEVTIPEGVTSIGNSAFNTCSSLTEVTIPGGVTTIGNYAFNVCVSLTEVVIPESVTSIGASAFSGCSSLRRVDVYSKDATYGNNVFYNCSKVKLVGYESSTTDIYAQANGKIFLTFDEVEKIDHAFGYRIFYVIDDAGILTISGKGDMKNFSSASSVPWYADRENIQQVIVEDGITSIGSYAFCECSNLTEVTISESVTSIGDYAFRYCSNLTEVAIPEGVTSIGDYAFYRCSLEKITFYSPTTTIGSKALTMSSTGVVVGFADSTAMTYAQDQNLTFETLPAVAGQCGARTYYQLEEDGTFKIIGKGAMYDYDETNEVPWYAHRDKICAITFENTVTSIGDRAFYDCDSLQNVIIPSHITEIGASAFAQCDNLQKVEFETSDVVINADAFHANLWQLLFVGVENSTAQRYAEEYGIPFRTSQNIQEHTGICGLHADYILDEDGILTISGAGSICTYLGSEKIWVPWASRTSEIKEIVIGEGITEIGPSAFSGCANVQSIKMPSTITTIADGAIEANTLHTVVVGYEDSAAQNYADNNRIPFLTYEKYEIADGVCGLASYYTLDETGTLTIYGEGAICNYPESEQSFIPWSERAGEVKQIVIDKNVTEIGKDAFSGCTGLKTVRIPSSTVVIEDGAFEANLWHMMFVGQENSTAKEYAAKNNIPFATYETYANMDGICGLTAYYKLDSSGTLLIYGEGDICSYPGYEGEWVPWKNQMSTVHQVMISEEITDIGTNAFAANLWELVLIGPKDSGTQTYAKEHSIPYISLEDYKVADGICGLEAYYILDEDGTLTIKGTGAICTYPDSDELWIPWQKQSDQIENIVIEEGITKIGASAFAGCENVQKVAIYSATTELDVTAIKANVWNLLMVGPAESSSQIYAKENNIPFLTFDEYEEADGICGLEAYYILDEDGTLTIKGTGAICTYPGSEELWIPWQEQADQIKTIVIEDGITKIGASAFAGCENVQIVEIYSETTEIDATAIKANVWNLLIVGLSESSSQIYAKENNIPFLTFDEYEEADGICGVEAYYILDEDGTLTISGEGEICTYPGYEDIWVPWINQMDEISEVIIPDSITYVGKDAFSANGLRLVIKGETGSAAETFADANEIPFLSFAQLEEVDGICGPDAFYKLQDDGTLFITGTGEICNYPGNEDAWVPWTKVMNEIQSVIISTGITRIGTQAFAGCTELKTITFYSESNVFGGNILSGVTLDALYAFEGSDAEMYAKDSGIPVVLMEKPDGKCGENVFYTYETDGVLLISGIGEMWDYSKWSAAPWKNQSVSEVRIMPGITYIGDYAFANCETVQKVSIPDSVTQIGDRAFYQTNLQNLTILEHIQKIGDLAFAEIANMSVVKIYSPEMVIGYNAFADSPNLILFGYTDSTTQTYAEENDVRFVPLDLEVKAISVSKMPDKLEYYSGDVLELQGLKLRVVHADDSISYETYGWDAEYDFSISGMSAVTITYGKQTTTFEVNVIQPQIVLSEQVLTMKVGDQAQLQATTIPKDVSVAWSSNDTSIVSVDNGRVRAWKAGTASVTAEFIYNGHTYSQICSITVEELKIQALEGFLQAYNEVHLTWDATEHATSYRVYYRTARSSSSTYVGSTQSTYQTICDLEVNTEYVFTVVPYNASTGTDCAGIASAITIFTRKPVGEMSSIEAVLTDYNDVQLTWDAAEEATQYDIYYKLTEETDYTRLGSVATTFYRIADLADGLEYDFKVIPYYETETFTCYGAEAVASITTMKPIGTMTTVKAKLYGHNDVQVYWSQASNAIGYMVYYKKTSASKYTYLGKTSKTYYKKANLSDGVKYTFKVIPYNIGAGYADYGTAKTISIYTLKKISTPKVSKASSAKVTVKWTNINGESGYQISQSTKKSKTKIVYTYNTTSGKSRTIKAKKGVNYYYKVRAYKTVGGKKIYGPWSRVKSYKVK